MKKLVLFIFLVSILVGCTEEQINLPKPRMYPKVNYPERAKYKEFEMESCPFKFDYPSYSEIKQSEVFDANEERNDCWFDIHYTGLNAVLYCSYNKINSQKEYDDMVAKNYFLVNKHNKRADYINENVIVKDNIPIGIQFEIEGAVATPFQFMISDNTSHFFRASLYFDAPSNQDSLAPIYKFVKEDIDKMIASFEWLD